MDRKIIKILLLLLLYTYSHAQIDSYIGAYSGNNKNGYLEPLASVLTSVFNTGQINHAAIDSNFHFYFHLIGSSALILSDNLKYFNASTPADFEPSQTISVSTLLGPRESKKVAGINGLGYLFPAGIGVKFLTIVVPQLTLAYKGTEINARFFAYDTKEDLGKINLWGIGLRHDIGRYFMKQSRWAITIGGMYQNLKLGTYSDLNTYSVALTIGQQNKHLYYFGHAGYQSGKLNGTYKHYNGENFENIAIDLSGTNPLLVALGGGVRAGALQIQLQVSGIAPLVTTASIGVKF